MDTGIASLIISNENHSLDIQNQRDYNNNVFDSVNACDEVQRKKAIDRVYCDNQFTWYTLSNVFYMIILPILIIIFILVLDNYYKNLNYKKYIPYFIVWTVFGVFYSTYMRAYGWNVMRRNMFRKDILDINNCFKDVKSY